MQSSVLAIRRYSNRTVGVLLAFVFAITAHTVSATTFMSVEPIPSGDVVGQPELDRIRGIGFENLELWPSAFWTIATSSRTSSMCSRTTRRSQP